MKLPLYLIGGFLLWLGGYSYLKTRRSAGMRPTGMLPGGRKSVEPMAARVQPQNVRSAHQSMHHLVADAD